MKNAWYRLVIGKLALFSDKEKKAEPWGGSTKLLTLGVGAKLSRRLAGL
jgi:hypothetical protein